MCTMRSNCLETCLIEEVHGTNDQYIDIYLEHPYFRRIALSGLLQQALLSQPSDDLSNTLFDGVFVGLDDNLGVCGLFIGSSDASKLLDLASTSLLVETLGVALLGNLEGDINVDLDERNGFVIVVCALSVQRASKVTVGPVGRDEGGDCDGGGVGEELGDLGSWC